MLVRFWQTALFAAMGTLLGSPLWAQQNCCISGLKCCAAKDCCAKDDCCKDSKCGKEATCCKDGKCCNDGKCCEDKKCDCTAGGDCCCKKGECKCKKTKKVKASKNVKIIVVMPSLPMMEPLAMMPHPLPPPPPLLAPPGLPLPPSASGCCVCPLPTTACIPAPPCPNIMVSKEGVGSCPSALGAVCDLCSVLRSLSAPSLCASALGMLSEVCPTTASMPMPTPLCCTPTLNQRKCPNCGVLTMGVDFECNGPPILPHPMPSAPVPPPQLVGMGMCPYGSLTTFPSGEVVPCVVPMPTTGEKVSQESKICICAKPSGSQLEMTIGDKANLQCKKMNLKFADNEIVLTRFDDRVRVHGDDLKAMADTVRSESKNRLILEGNVVLHYKKDGQSANVSGACVEVNLATGAMTIKPAGK